MARAMTSAFNFGTSCQGVSASSSICSSANM
jgi:hypothetical protein